MLKEEYGLRIVDRHVFVYWPLGKVRGWDENSIDVLSPQAMNILWDKGWNLKRMEQFVKENKDKIDFSTIYHMVLMKEKWDKVERFGGKTK